MWTVTNDMRRPGFFMVKNNRLGEYLMHPDGTVLSFPTEATAEFEANRQNAL